MKYIKLFEEHTSGEDYESKYKALDNAVKDLLAELDINDDSLDIMAKGYSPKYPGVENFDTNSTPKVQLSQIVAQKILNTLDRDYLDNTDNLGE